MADITSRFVAPGELVKEQGICLLVYGAAGSGKTVLCTTAPSPTLILSAEGGLLSIRDNTDVKALELRSVADIKEAYETLYDNPNAFRTVCLDSISEVSEVVLANEKAKTKDPRAAYGTVIDEVMGLLRAFRDLPMDVIMTAKIERVRDEGQGTMLYMPSMVGRQLPQAIPYLFDEVFALRIVEDDDGNAERVLQTAKDWQYEAKDRSGALNTLEPANVASIFAKIRGKINKTKTSSEAISNDKT
jgi:phage nucleotide-binding protein|tara:strand:+ start:314 stop:1048 length:735 start_codon:yes stop_codon:yes gene_type:complete